MLIVDGECEICKSYPFTEISFFRYIQLKFSELNFTMATTLVVDDAVFQQHIPMSSIPETPGRTLAISQALHKEFDNDDRITWHSTPFMHTNVNLEDVHTKEYVTQVKQKTALVEKTGIVTTLSNDDDVPFGPGSYEAAMSAVAAVLDATKIVLDTTRPEIRAFCNVRPPGHHAAPHKAQGFCIFNNIAFGVNAALYNPNVSRVAIIDWDLHHGNGTQKIFWDNPDVMYFSLHPRFASIFPRTGRPYPADKGDHDNIRNYNLNPNQPADQQARSVFDKLMLPKLRSFNPDIVFISCGFDGHKLDPMQSLDYTASTYKWMTEEVVKFANEHCGGRIVSVLEGGYNDRALRESSVAHVKALIDGEAPAMANSDPIVTVSKPPTKTPIVVPAPTPANTPTEEPVDLEHVAELSNESENASNNDNIDVDSTSIELSDSDTGSTSE